jgi:hypothetical protein
VSKGIIAGAVISGVAGLALIAGAIAFLFRNRRRKSQISMHQISAPVNVAPAYEVAGPDFKPAVELENERSYFELPADRVYEIRGTELGKPAGRASEIGGAELEKPADGASEIKGTEPGIPEDIRKDVPYI